MSALHTISGSPSSGLLNSCVKLIRPGDGILFIENGVYYGCLPDLTDCVSEDNALFALREDLLARGVLSKLAERIDPVGYARFVELTVDYDKVISWS